MEMLAVALAKNLCKALCWLEAAKHSCNKVWPIESRVNNLSLFLLALLTAKSNSLSQLWCLPKKLASEDGCFYVSGLRNQNMVKDRKVLSQLITHIWQMFHISKQQTTHNAFKTDS